MNRTIINIIIFGSVFLFPWYVPCALSIVAVFLLDYPEIILVGAILDALYGLFGFPQALFSTLGFAVFAISLYLKPRLSLYNPL